jgi:hypothetical protein
VHFTRQGRFGWLIDRLTGLFRNPESGQNAELPDDERWNDGVSGGSSALAGAHIA